MINRTRRSPLAGDAFPLAGAKGIARKRAPTKATYLFALFGLLGTTSGIIHADQPTDLSPARTAEAANLVDIRSLAPDIAEDIKYAGSDNFVGRPVDGYRAPKCFLLRPVAEALARVERDLRAQHSRLKIFDCYRPARAVADFVRWAHDLGDQRTKPQHYPTLDKSKLLHGYIASVSGHSRGATIDLGMEQCAADGSHCTPLDMGTDFDYFGTRANTDNPGITPVQHANRQRLLAAMAREGFKNYPMEWWHYTFMPEPTPHTLYDVPVE